MKRFFPLAHGLMMSTISPYFTPPREEGSVSGRITRSRARLLAIDESPSTRVGTRKAASARHEPDSDAGPSTPTKNSSRGEIKEVAGPVLPPTPESLPKPSKRARRTVKPAEPHVSLGDDDVVLAKVETGNIEPIVKIHLAQGTLALPL